MSAAVAFRVDSSESAGSGHTMRCLALAGELSALGGEPAFVARDAPGNVNAAVTASGYTLNALPGAASGGSPTDAADTSLALSSRVAWMVVDHYDLDAAWERAIKRTSAENVFAIDDLGRAHECDLLLDQNTAGPSELYRDRVPAGCRRLLGPGFALLRREFLRRRRRLRARDGALERLLVCFGSADGANQTPKALAALARPSFRGLAIDVVVGRANRRADAVERRCADLPNATFHLQTDDMPALIADADLAIGAAGSMTWERCCLGLPTLTIVCARNQQGPATTGARAGATLDLGAAQRVDEALIANTVEALRADPPRLARMSAAGMGLVDGQGARRVAEAMLGFDVADVRADDVDQLWHWANDPAVRGHAFRSDPIPLEAHMRWFSERLNDARCRIYVARVGTKPVGQVRLEVTGDRAFVDISVDREWRGRGIGSRTLELALERFGAAWPGVDVVAQVKAGNTASQELFARAGFTSRASTRPDAVELEWRARHCGSVYNP